MRADASPGERTRTLAALAAIVACFGGCGGGAAFENGVFDDGLVRYRVGLPGGGFRRVAVGDNDVAFFHEQLGTIAINSTCKDYEDVPERALLNHLLFGTRERHYRLEEVVTLDGRGALHTVVDLELDGVPLTLEVYLVKKDGCVYDLSRTSSREAFTPGRPHFSAFARSFAVLDTRID